jgi:hypothetical protein
MKTMVIHDKPDFSAQITYAFNVLLGTLGISFDLYTWSDGFSARAPRFDEDHLVILYGSKDLDVIAAHRKLHVYSSDFFGVHYLSAELMPTVPLSWIQLGTERCPILYQADSLLNGNPILVTTEDAPIAAQERRQDGLSIYTNSDFLASSFFMLSRYEEALIQERDHFGRFPLEANLAFREDFWRLPIVNLYAKLLGDWIAILTDGKLKPKPPHYPEGHSFGLCLTHDVDHPRKFTFDSMLRTIAKVMLGRESPRQLRQIGRYLLTGKDPFWNFDQIVASERAHGFSSTFFLIMGGQHRRDPAYANKPDERARACRAIMNLGAEVGLHGSFESYIDARVMGEEWHALSELANVMGCRQHYLRLDTQRSFAVMEQVGLRYDCTLGFSGEIGFRSGLAAPHYPFNLEENRPFRVLEIPLVVMDRTLWASCVSRGLKPEEIFEEVLQVLAQVREYNGCVSILWHNGFFDDVAYPGYGDLYESLLRWLWDNGGWGASGKQVYDWFVNG